MRATWRSMSRSHRSFTTQPAARITTLPSANSTISRTDSRAVPPRRAGCPTGRAGTAARCRSADRPGPAADRAARTDGSRATQPVAAISVCACMAATLRVSMTGSIRLLCGPSRLPTGRERSPRARAGTLSRHRDAPRGGRHGAAVQRARRRIRRPDRRHRGATGATLQVERSCAAAGCRTRSVAGIRAAEARRHRPGGAEGDRTRGRRRCCR